MTVILSSFLLIFLLVFSLNFIFSSLLFDILLLFLEYPFKLFSILLFLWELLILEFSPVKACINLSLPSLMAFNKFSVITLISFSLLSVIALTVFLLLSVIALTVFSLLLLIASTITPIPARISKFPCLYVCFNISTIFWLSTELFWFGAGFLFTFWIMELFGVFFFILIYINF